MRVKSKFSLFYFKGSFMFKLYFLLLLLVGSSLQAEGIAGVDKATRILNSIIDIFTGTLLQSISALAFIGAGIMYITGKGQQAKDKLIDIMIGSIIVLAASGLTSLFV
jgi:type IV secretory pathway VirB2 component (pilin)